MDIFAVRTIEQSLHLDAVRVGRANADGTANVTSRVKVDLYSHKGAKAV